MSIVNATPKRWTRDVYYDMGEKGIFQSDERVELLEGAIIPVSPQGKEHAFLISFLNTRLVHAFGQTHVVRVQLPLDLNEYSQPEPDVALVTIAEMRRAPLHPQMADLVIEVSHSSLKFDRHEKASIYAKAGLLNTGFSIPKLAKSKFTGVRPPTRKGLSSFAIPWFRFCGEGSRCLPCLPPTRPSRWRASWRLRAPESRRKSKKRPCH